MLSWLSLTFLLVNLLGLVVYYRYQVAPPWYVQQFGFGFIAATPGNTAGLARFDAFLYQLALKADGKAGDQV